MSDEESLPINTVFVDTVAISGMPKASDTEQPVRMPRSFEFACAVIGERPLAGWLTPIATFVGRWFLVVTGALWAVLVIAALFGFGGIAASAVSIGKILFFVFAVLAIASFLFGLLKGR